jgi:glycosyltransferase involved in cell wall biosynthesis
LLYQPDDPPALRRTVLTAVRDAELRRRLTTGARARVSRRSWANVTDELVSRHYTAVLPSLEPAA